jgi:hypothetical protein
LLGSGQPGDGERVEAFAQRGAGDRDGVDGVGLAAFACDAALADGELGRDADDGLAVSEQEALQRTGDMPAVFDRPHPFVAEAASPGQQGLKAPPLRRQRPLDQHPPARGLDGSERVRPLMRVGADHDHRWSPPSVAVRGRIAGGQFSVGKHECQASIRSRR